MASNGQDIRTAGAALASDLVQSIYDATLQEDAWHRIMAAVTPLLGCTMAMFVRVDRNCPRDSITEAIGVSAATLSDLRARDLEHDHIWRVAVRMPVGSVFRVSDVVSAALFTDSPLYPRIAAPAGLEYVVTATLENTSAFFSNFSLMRPLSDFSADEVDLLRRLVPHLISAHHIQRRIALGDAGRREALLSFDRAHQPVVVLDRSGYVIYRNSDAERVIDGTTGVRLKFGRFHFQNLPIQVEFERVMRLAIAAPAPDASAGAAPNPQSGPYEVRVPRQGPGAPLALSVIPVTRSSDRAVLPDGAACLVMMFDLDTPNPLPLSRLTWLYRLTPAEARVCESLFRVGSVDAVAEDLHLSRNTVRSHLKSVYAKFGIATQGQLMQRLATSLRLVGGTADGATDG